MPTSQYFPSYYAGYEGEQNLYQDLTDEQIKLFGTDIYYLPRTIIKENTLDDVIYSKFETQLQIEMILQNVEGFGNNSEFINKFGLKVTDEIVFNVSSRRWLQESETYDLGPRPLEGDLLFFPLTKDLYEIKYVKVEAVFHQFGKLQFYTITAELYEIGNETIETGISQIDNIDLIQSPAINIIFANNPTGLNFVVGEKVEGSVSNVSATVTNWNSTTKTLTVIDRTGTFIEEELVTGEISQAEWEIVSFSTIDDPNTQYEENKDIETEADDILVFDEINPFGEYGNFTGSF